MSKTLILLAFHAPRLAIERLWRAYGKAVASSRSIEMELPDGGACWTCGAHEEPGKIECLDCYYDRQY